MVKTEFEGREIISNYYRAKDEAEAIEMLETYDIHLIICSMFTKEGSTEIFIKSINEGKYEEIPIFIVSSTESDEDKKKFINLGITDFLTKSEIGEIYKHILIMFKQDELMKLLKRSKKQQFWMIVHLKEKC
jgi:PleD family two-component response regulator